MTQRKIGIELEWHNEKDASDDNLFNAIESMSGYIFTKKNSVTDTFLWNLESLPSIIFTFAEDQKQPPEMFLKVWQNSQEFIKKETLSQVFSHEFCEIFKNTFFTEHF